MRGQMKVKYKQSDRGDCYFFTALLGTVILLSFLFIIGVPKFVIALEYWDSCPLSPLIPLYLCLTGLLGVACVGHSAFLWACLFRRHMKKKASHDCCLVMWVLLMLSVPICQLIGAPYIIYTFHKIPYNTTECDVMQNVTASSNILHSSVSLPQDSIGVTIDTAPSSESPYLVNPKSTNVTMTSQEQYSHDCRYCSYLLMMCAYGTAIFELIFMTLPIFCLVGVAVIFRIRNKDAASV